MFSLLCPITFPTLLLVPSSLSLSLSLSLCLSLSPPFSIPLSLPQWYASPDYNLFSPYVEHRKLRPSQPFYVLHPRYVWQLWDLVQGNTRENIQPNPPSSGFIGTTNTNPYIQMYTHTYVISCLWDISPGLPLQSTWCVCVCVVRCVRSTPLGHGFCSMSIAAFCLDREPALL